MASTYFIANLTDTPDIELLYQLFYEAGDVQQLKLIHKKLNHRTWVYGFVKMSDDNLKPHLLRHFNGSEFQGQRLALSCIKPLTPLTMNPENQEFIEELAAYLQETTPESVRQLEQIVTWCGLDFARALLEETLAVEANGGMTTLDRSRRRTPGGVFFYLAKPRIYWQLTEKIFPQIKSYRPVVHREETRKAIPAEAQEKMAQFKASERDLEQRLRTMKATGNTAGMFSVTKQLAEIKQQIVQLQRRYPELEQLI
ncbi:MAG: hypothetical protein K8I82_02055 [Anaerolineae bacterium]|nr:hypothetical protein [Anaerolineae bacterium]